MLPAYVRYLDCALLPYVDSEWTRYQSPLKLWEYLYSGAPIVGMGSAELQRYRRWWSTWPAPMKRSLAWNARWRPGTPGASNAARSPWPTPGTRA